MLNDTAKVGQLALALARCCLRGDMVLPTTQEETVEAIQFLLVVALMVKVVKVYRLAAGAAVTAAQVIKGVFVFTMGHK
jgi:hypothetical protein